MRFGEDQFRAFHEGLPPHVKDIPVFVILYGESDEASMQRVAEMTGGKVFDARTTPMADIFTEIRAYQ